MLVALAAVALAAEPRVALGPMLGGGALVGFTTEVRVADPLRLEAWGGPRLLLGYDTYATVMLGGGVILELGGKRLRPAPFLRGGATLPHPSVQEDMLAVGCDLRSYGPRRRNFVNFSPGLGALYKAERGLAEWNPLVFLRVSYQWGIGGDQGLEPRGEEPAEQVPAGQAPAEQVPAEQAPGQEPAP